MTENRHFQTKRKIAFVLFEDFQILDATGPIAAFEIAARIRPDAYRLVMVAPKAGAVRSSSGLAVLAQGFVAARGADTILVAGGEGVRGAVEDRALVGFLRRAEGKARRIGSVCSGSYLLAVAGLLDGRRATTHWRRARHFAARFPRIRVEADRLYVRDGHVWTSAGISAGIDLALALIADDLGDDAAKQVAQQLVLYQRRPGGQSQFSAMLDLAKPEGRFTALLQQAGERLADDLGVEALANEMAMSPRNFARLFTKETGMTPARAIERLRLDAARTALEQGAASLTHVARETGFSETERMRRAFLRAYGRPPQAFRPHRTKIDQTAAVA